MRSFHFNSGKLPDRKKMAKSIYKFSVLHWLIMVFLITFTISAVPYFPAHALSGDSPFAPVRSLLLQDGFDQNKIDQILDDPRVEPAFRSVSLFFVHSEARLNYDQFTTTESIENALQYIQKHKDLLVEAEKKYGVDKNVITAILMVETRLGTFTGTSPTFNTLATMASLKDPARRNILFENISNPRRLSREQFEKQADRRWNWAYGQLKAFLEYTERENMDPLSIYGSYAGAIGIAQFLPTSILAYAKDGNHDGRIDLFTHEDAIASVANYLKTFGWKPGITREEAEKAIFAYNRSSYYVNTVLTISELLEK